MKDKRKFIYYFIPIVALRIFVLVMVSGTYFKNSTSIEGNFPGHLESVKTDINNGQWGTPAADTEKMDNAWKKVLKRVQFSAGRDEMNQIDMNLSRLRGA